MKIKVFQTSYVSGYEVYLRQLGTFFEYLIIIDGKLYTFGQNIKPRMIRRMIHFIVPKIDIYSQREIAGVLSLLKMQAKATIENHIK